MLTIELNETTEGKLRAEARSKGVPPEVYAREILEEVLLPARTEGQRLVEQWRQDGVIGSRPDVTDGDKYSRELRERAWQRSAE